MSSRTWLPRKVDIEYGEKIVHEGVVIREGVFQTPAMEIKHRLPAESLQARALFVTPEKVGSNDVITQGPAVILLAGTGEHGYRRRLSTVALPLAKQSGISSIILESPFYGTRRPPNQIGSKLRQVTDLALMGRVTLEETCSLLRLLSEDYSINNLAISGVSMGGLHSAMAATLSPLPVGVVSWLGPPSATPVFTEGLLSRFCEWKRLQTELGTKALAKDMMRQVLGLTDIANFPPPVDPTRGIFVIAENDLYVPKDLCMNMWLSMQQGQWRGSTIKLVPGGHVSATIFGAKAMRRCIEKVLNVREGDPFDDGDV